MYYSLLILIALVFTGCASISAPSSKVIVAYEGNPVLHFEGKGSAAGIMLMGAMGPAGIAIGVAIDVGIAKDIAKAYKQSRSDFIKKAKPDIAAMLTDNTMQHIAVNIKGYGFKFRQGQMYAWLKGDCTKYEKLTLFDELFKVDLTVSALKSNGKLVEASLTRALVNTIKNRCV